MNGQVALVRPRLPLHSRSLSLAFGTNIIKDDPLTDLVVGVSGRWDWPAHQALRGGLLSVLRRQELRRA